MLITFTNVLLSYTNRMMSAQAIISSFLYSHIMNVINWAVNNYLLETYKYICIYACVCNSIYSGIGCTGELKRCLHPCKYTHTALIICFLSNNTHKHDSFTTRVSCVQKWTCCFSICVCVYMYYLRNQ